MANDSAEDRALYKLLDVLYQRDNDGRNAWDYRRVCYDLAVGGRWDSRINRPFSQNAPSTLKRAAISIAQEMIDNPDKIEENFERSSGFRR